MPLPRDLVHLYRGPHWEQLRMQIVNGRAKGRCEWCSKPNRTIVVTVHDGTRRWRRTSGGYWRDDRGRIVPAPPKRLARVRSRCVLTLAHLDRVPGNDQEDNLAALCQHCHLTYDSRQHQASARRTRARRAGQTWLEGME